jgi:hypothetical protein
MNNPEKLATLGTHHTGQRDKNKTLNISKEMVG